MIKGNAFNTIEGLAAELRWWRNLAAEYGEKNMFAAQHSCVEQIKVLEARAAQLNGFDEVWFEEVM